MYMKEELIFATGGRSNYRIPSIVAGNNGTIFAFCNDRKETVADDSDETALVCVRKKPGKDWEPVRTLMNIPDWACTIGSAVYDAVTDCVMCSVWRIPKQKNEFAEYTEEELAEIERRERKLGMKGGQFLLWTMDAGETWQERPLAIEPATYTHWDGTVAQIGGQCHGCEHGIQLRHGQHRGRLLCPSRTQIGNYTSWESLRKSCYNNSIYSDDHGVTWKASTPVQLATGEGALIENGDGTITYNSRAYFQDQKRYLATSTDGGATYGDFRTDDFLMEEKNIGCNASFLRVEREDIKEVSLLPKDADAITVFCNPRSKTRDHMTACISFDDGKTWEKTKRIYEGPCAYSSLTFSVADQHFYLLYERGKSFPNDQGIVVAEFDLEWLLA